VTAGRTAGWLGELASDARYACRGLVHTPWFSVPAIMCLALGIGLATLVFSVVDKVLLRPLPFADADRLVIIWFTPPSEPDRLFATNTGVYFTIAERAQVFEKVGAARISNNNFNVASESSAVEGRERVQAQWFSQDMIDVLGVNPILGRWHAVQDAGSVFNYQVISYGLWQRMFGGSRDVLGKRLYLNEHTGTVIGVMPPGFELLAPADFWIRQHDIDLRRAAHSRNRLFTVVAKLKRGVTLEQAQANMNALAPAIAAEFPESHDGWSVRLQTLHDAYFGHLRVPLLVFQIAALLVLVIAAANVAGLLMARAVEQRRRLAIRAALGCTPGRLARQLIVDIIVLALAGYVGAVGLAAAGLLALDTMQPATLARVGELSLEPRILVASFLVTLIMGMAIGAFHAHRVSRADHMNVFRASPSNAVSPVQHRIRSGLVVVQVALSMIMLIGASLLVNSLLRVSMRDAGFDPRGLLTMQVTPAQPYTGQNGNTPAGGLLVDVNPRTHARVDQMRDRIAATPGVEAVTVTVVPPLGGMPRQMPFTEAGRVIDASLQDAWVADWYPVGSDYFSTLGVPVIAGREFGRGDGADGQQVVIVNEALARQFWPDGNALGRHIQVDTLFDRPREIVGIVGDVRQDRYELRNRPQLFVPMSQLPARMDMALNLETSVTTFVIRTGGADAGGLIQQLRGKVYEVDATAAVSNPQSVEDYSASQLRNLRHYSGLLAVFALLSLTLSVAGLFALTSHAVSQRTSEIGLRRALGAPAGSILGGVLRQGLGVVVIGLVIGAVIALALTWTIQSLLWGVDPTDGVTFAVAAGVLGCVASIACYVPARRALRISELAALRAE
jgi:putative ABC transport system permease protein